MIHSQSALSGGPFLRVNCSAIPPELIDSQLFGHERGVFTGAVEARQGWFERADGGTLLLDEVGELPLAAQVRLLRILQDGWMERVGGHEPVHVECTYRRGNTPGPSGHGSRRSVPGGPLVPYCRISSPSATSAPAPGGHSGVGEALCRPRGNTVRATVCSVDTGGHPPANVLSVAGEHSRIGCGHRIAEQSWATANDWKWRKRLGATVKPAVVSPVAVASSNGAPRADGVLSLDEAMRRRIERVLAVTHGRIEGRRGTAALLKINPHTLRARMRKLGIDWAKYRVEEEA